MQVCPRPSSSRQLGAGRVCVDWAQIVGWRRLRSGSGRDEGSVIPPRLWAPDAARFPPPARQPRGPCAIPAEWRKPARGGAEPGPRCRSRPGGCARDSRPAGRRGGRARERTEHGTERRADGPTDGRSAPHAGRAELGEVPVTYTHSHPALTHTGTHAHSRARTSSRQPARPLAGARSPWPVSAASQSAPLCGELGGGGRRSLPGGPATDLLQTSRRRSCRLPPPRPPMGFDAPGLRGRVLHAREGTRRGQAKEQQPLPRSSCAVPERGGIAMAVPGPSSAAVAVRGSCCITSRVRSSGGRLRRASLLAC